MTTEIVRAHIEILYDRTEALADAAVATVEEEGKIISALLKTVRAHNRHVLRTTDLKDITPGRMRRAAQANRTWAKRRP